MHDSQKYEFYFLLFMSFFISGVITLIMGLFDGVVGIWAEALVKAFIVTYPTIMVVIPQARRIATKLLL